MTFVACDPLADSAGVISQPTAGHNSNHLDPRALGSERVIMSLPSPLLRPDAPVSTTPPDFPSSLVIQEALPDDLVWAVADTFPALGQYSFHACRHLYAGRRSRSLSPMSPCSHRLPQQSSESAPPPPPTSASVGVHFSTLSVFASLRPTWLLALLDRSDLETGLSGRRGPSTRAFPQGGHPPRESGIATRHPGRTP